MSSVYTAASFHEYMKIFIIAGLILSSFLVWYLHPTFLHQPQVWPDEAVYSDIAHNINSSGTPSTTIWGDMLFNTKERALLYPPVFFYSIAFWQNMFGPSITAQRLLSLFIGFMTIALIYGITKILIKETTNLKSRTIEIYATIAALSAMIDFFLIRSATVSRPEIFIIFLSLASLYTFTWSEIALNKKYKLWLNASSGLIAGLSILIHPIGILPLSIIGLYFIFKHRHRIILKPAPYITLAATLIPVSIWIFTTVIPFWDTYIAQMIPHLELKKTTPHWLWQVFTTSEPLIMQVSYLLYGIITVISFIMPFFTKRKWDIFIALTLFLSWFALITGKMFWYASLPIPFIYIAITIVLSRIHSKEKISLKHFNISQSYATIAGIIISLVIINTSLQITIKKSEMESHHSYSNYTNQILNHIPNNATVFMSAIPDPYYGFKTNNRQNKLYEFPMWPAERNSYLDVLNNSDYIIYNGIYEPSFFGTLLHDYIEKNSEGARLIGKKGEYQAYIITLKPLEERMTSF